jgi:hypothetical protein
MRCYRLLLLRHPAGARSTLTCGKLPPPRLNTTAPPAHVHHARLVAVCHMPRGCRACRSHTPLHTHTASEVHSLQQQGCCGVGAVCSGHASMITSRAASLAMHRDAHACTAPRQRVTHACQGPQPRQLTVGVGRCTTVCSGRKSGPDAPPSCVLMCAAVAPTEALLMLLANTLARRACCVCCAAAGGDTHANIRGAAPSADDMRPTCTHAQPHSCSRSTRKSTPPPPPPCKGKPARSQV